MSDVGESGDDFEDEDSDDGNVSNCSSAVHDCEDRIRLIREDGVHVNQFGETDSDEDELVESDGSHSDGYNSDGCTDPLTAKWLRLESVRKKGGGVKLAASGSGVKWYKNCATSHRLVGGRRKKGEKRTGFTQATQCYGPGELSNGDPEYMQPNDQSLMPVRIVTDDFAWGSIDKMRKEKTDVRLPVLRKWDSTNLPSIGDMFLSMIKEPLEVFRRNTNVKGGDMTAAKKAGKRDSRNHAEWSPLSNGDCIAYLSAMLRIQACNKRHLTHSWSTDSYLRDPAICELSSDTGMSRRKYRRVMGATRLYDAAAAEVSGASDKTSPRYDTQCRIRPFIDAANRSFQEHRIPGDFISLDESMMRFKGRFVDLQRMPLKPIRNGIKNFYLCDPDGYTYRILPHTSQSLKYSAECGYIFAVVMALLDGDEKSGLVPYLDSGRTVVTDRYYTSVPIAIALADRRTYYIGTIKRQAKNCPSMVKVAPDGTQRDLIASKRFQRGSSQFWFDTSGRLMYVVWADSKNVHMLSSYPYTTTQQGLCRRRQRGTSRQLELPRPQIIALFNDAMSGVDICDQLIESAQRHQRNRFWFSTFFERVISLAAVNVRAVLSEGGRKMSMLEVKNEIAKSLAAIAKSCLKPPLNRKLITLSREEIESRKRSSAYQHQFTVLTAKARGRCAECRLNNGNVRCADCDNVVLHSRCWQAFHNGDPKD